MWLLIAEMVLALSAIVFIMWWTLRARVDHAAPPEDSAPANTGMEALESDQTQTPGKPAD